MKKITTSTFWDEWGKKIQEVDQLQGLKQGMENILTDPRIIAKCKDDETLIMSLIMPTGARQNLYIGKADNDSRNDWLCFYARFGNALGVVDGKLTNKLYLNEPEQIKDWFDIDNAEDLTGVVSYALRHKPLIEDSEASEDLTNALQA